MNAIPKPPYTFDGATFEIEHDQVRLTGQMLDVYALMRDGHWRTLQEIETMCVWPQASISARLRDLRKPRFGSHTVERRRRGESKRGLFEYRLVVPAGRQFDLTFNQPTE